MSATEPSKIPIRIPVGTAATENSGATLKCPKLDLSDHHHATYAGVVRAVQAAWSPPDRSTTIHEIANSAGTTMNAPRMLRARQKFGKYVIERRIGQGGFAEVYAARDTIEGIKVALKIPFPRLLDHDAIQLFLREARTVAKLDHPNILPLKYADYVEGRFVIVTALGMMTLADRLKRRLGTEKAMGYAEQMVAAVSYAHQNSIVHCDIKPDNFLIFPDDRIRLADFGIAVVARHTIQGSGSGTMGYIAPEQAMGHPSTRSDVFSLGLVLYEMLSGTLPTWPYAPPLPGWNRLRKRMSPECLEVLQQAIEVQANRRFANASRLQQAFQRVCRQGRGKRPRTHPERSKTSEKLQSLKFKMFQRQFGTQLETRHTCRHCEGPIAESMQACPWCGKSQERFHGVSRRSLQCPRCYRGLKSDWHYCPWCFGGGFEASTTRQLSDKKYSAKCDNGSCPRQWLMPFMRYCPWCRRRVRKRWPIEGARRRCRQCGWGTLPDYWDYCPWCSKRLQRT